MYAFGGGGLGAAMTGAALDHGYGSHGIWPNPDNTRIYVALQNSDAVDVIDTHTKSVIKTLRIGQSPMALVYVARGTPATSTGNLGRQGLGMPTKNLPLRVLDSSGQGAVLIRALPGIDEDLSYSYFFANHYTSVILKPGTPPGEQPPGPADPMA
ncbi:YncE family protein [Streptomyces sp. NPDC001984]|uniref:YncE family protein n=1 Tax=Streptomyces sp. NPDC002619 TaxID=3364655 RepID=UPI0036C305E7